jgi:2-iminobutanoate/2-iminopropanoate deaminase
MKKVINTVNAPAAIGPYSQANMANGILYISGQIPVDPATGKLVEGIEKKRIR